MSSALSRNSGDQFPTPDESATSFLINLKQAAKSLPPGRSGRPAHVATLARWITSGSRGPNGETVRLRAIRMGGRWLTSAQ